MAARWTPPTPSKMKRPLDGPAPVAAPALSPRFASWRSWRTEPTCCGAARMSQYATDEITLARDVVPALSQGMLCLADRFFPSYKLWRAAAHTGADLLWRTRQNARLDVDQRLPDGSYLSRLYASTSDRRNQRKGIMVRVIDYRLKGVQDAEPIYRLITTILDPLQAPAQELAALYHERWERETALDELKTHLRRAQIVLRSKTPELVE